MARKHIDFTPEMGNNPVVLNNGKQIKNIMLVVDRQGFLNTVFWVKIIDMIENELNRRKIQFLFKIIDDTRGSIGNFETLPDGFIILGLVPLEVIDEIAKTKLPIVLVDSKYLDLKCDHVRANNHQGAYMMTEMIIKKGHRNILYIGDTAFAASFAERFNGINDCINSHTETEIKVSCVKPNKNNLQQSFHKDEFIEIMTQKDRPTVIFCANDSIAVEVYTVLKQLNLKIPEDVSVVGFDNIRDSKLIEPNLTTVDVPKVDLALVAVETIINKIANPARRNSLIMMQTEIVERASLADLNI